MTYPDEYAKLVPEGKNNGEAHMFGLGKLARVKGVSDYIVGYTYAWNRCLDRLDEETGLSIFEALPDIEYLAEALYAQGVRRVPFEMPDGYYTREFVEGVNAYMVELYERMDNVSA